MERPATVTSPFTGGAVREEYGEEERTYRKERFKVHASCYVCADTGKRFTTEEQEVRAARELESAYRVRHGIPFPDEIASVRKRHGLNYAQITKILGFGANQYARYESGFLPSESNGKMIAALRNPSLLLELLEESRALFVEKEYVKLRAQIVRSVEQPSRSAKELQMLYRDTRRSPYNGFAPCDPARLEAVVCHLVRQSGGLGPVRLGKLLYLSDTLHYRRHGIGITGLRYRQTPFGPLPEHFDTIYDNIKGIERHYRLAAGSEEAILTATAPGGILLGSTEQAVLDETLRETATLPTRDLAVPLASRSEDNALVAY